MTYRDCLNKLNSHASISLFGGNYGNPGTGNLVLCKVSDAPDKSWPYISRDVSNIVKEMEADGWICEVGLDGYNAPKIDLIHAETQKAIEAEAEINNAKFANATKGFIRFGKAPKNGKSWNYRDNIPEIGVSVFRAEFTKTGEYRLVINHVEKASYLAVCDRPAYRIYGDVIGTGADGEPVVNIKKSVKIR